MILTHGINSIERVPYYVDGPLIEGKQYTAVKIGNKIWTCENLDYKYFSIGGPYINDLDYKHAWYINNDELLNGWNGRKCGLLYTWAAVKYLEDNKNNMLPDGWRVPTYSEYEELVSFVGGWNTAGKLLKNKISWNNDWNGINKFGLNIIPAGCFDDDGFRLSSDYAMIWTATEYSSTFAKDMRFNTTDSALESVTGNYKVSARSVRLIKSVF